MLVLTSSLRQSQHQGRLWPSAVGERQPALLTGNCRKGELLIAWIGLECGDAAASESSKIKAISELSSPEHPPWDYQRLIAGLKAPAFTGVAVLHQNQVFFHLCQ